MIRWKETGKTLAIALLGGILALGLYAALGEVTGYNGRPVLQQVLPGRLTDASPEGSVDFTVAAALVNPAVVHIKSTGKRSESTQRNPFEGMPNNPFREFFEGPNAPRGGRMEPSMSSGSGVIISQDGYIVTNNHVIEDASKIEVSLQDNRSYQATLIGTDPSTDLALLKIKDKELPFLRFGDSESLRIGEWVLAVGNPFNLTSTVTAGIVSAKARSINILQDKYRIESFIQTDAAVNPGNSGGALVNLRGDLIGINTAIASQTGSYAGYSFAIPATLVQKVIKDIMEFGEVQRGFLGIVIRDVDGTLAEQENLKVTRGAFVNEVNEGSAAAEAGVKKGDVVVKVGELKIGSSSELQEQIGLKRPGDKVQLTILRKGQEMNLTVTLKGKSGTTKLAEKSVSESAQMLGADLIEVPAELQKDLNLKGGAQVKNLRAGVLREAGVVDDFVITHVDKKPVTNPEEVQKLLKNISGAALIEGMYPNGRKAYFALSF
jgi:serine protease Do